MNLPMISKNRVQVATWSELEDRSPAYALVADVDLVVVRYDDRVSVMYGRCHHRGALLADGHIDTYKWLQKLRDLKYAGPICVEYCGEGDPHTAAKRDLRYLNDCMALL